MSFNFDQENYKKLKQLILSSRKSNIVPFVGAGLSLYGPPEKRLPKWWELVDRILELAKVNRLTADQAAEIELLMKSEQHIEALNKLYTEASVEWVSQTVEQILEIDADGISPAAISLMAISWTLVVTTNLDRMLELAHEELELKERRPKNSLTTFTSRNEDAFLRSMSIESAARTSLAKIHGTVEDYQSFVLTTSAYNQLQENGVYRFILQDLFRRTLLIIGFSLQDPDFDWAMDHVAKNFRERNSPPYVILPDSVFDIDPDHPYRLRIKHLQQFNDLRVITYRVENSPSADDVWSGHKELFECINDLSNTWFENYKKLRIHGNILPEEVYFVGREFELLKIDQMIFETNKPCQIQGFGGEGKTALVSHWLKSRDSELSKKGIKNAFVFNCYVDSPAEFFANASQTLGRLPAGMSRGEQRASILTFVKTQKTLFVFDRFEIFQAPERNGEIRDKFLQSFLEELITFGSLIMLTTRITVPSLENPIFLNPLKGTEIDELVDLFLPSTPHPVTLRTALEHLQGHAQSIKLFLSNQESNGKAHSSPFIPTQNQSESLTDNKAIYTLENVQAGLSINEDIVLRIASIFRYPFTLDTIRLLLNEDLEMLNGWINENQDDDILAKCVNNLVDKHLIISNDGPVTYLLHPNVRDYYKSVGSDHGEIHSAYVNILREQIADEPIRTVSQANQYFSLAYHAAMAKNWSLYDYYYQKVLMRDQEDYVCDTLGMWSETLDLTRYVFPNGHPDTHAKIQSAYYSSRYARSLKHLGYGSEAADSYDSCLCFCAEELFPKSTIYVNNYLTLEIYRGNLKKAANMSSWNFASMQWIESENGVCNQTEHGGYSIELFFNGLVILGDSALSKLSLAEVPSSLLIIAFLGVLVLILPKGFPGRWLGLLFILPSVVYQSESPKIGEFSYTLLDVGQGYASVLKTQNHHLVYDTGTRFSESFDLGKLVVAPYLQSQGIKTLNMMMISHEDIDHRGGAQYLQENFVIDKILSSDVGANKHEFMTSKACIQGQKWQWDGVNFEVLSPALGFVGNDNNRSCVLKVWNQYHSILLTGDIQKQTEKSLLKSHPDKLQAEVISVPHHGSKTSSTADFLKQVSPKIGLISAGYRSRYGHPKPEIVKRYQGLGIELLDTVNYGAISLSFPADNSDIKRAYYRLENKGFWSR